MRKELLVFLGSGQIKIDIKRRHTAEEGQKAAWKGISYKGVS